MLKRTSPVTMCAKQISEWIVIHYVVNIAGVGTFQMMVFVMLSAIQKNVNMMAEIVQVETKEWG